MGKKKTRAGHAKREEGLLGSLRIYSIVFFSGACVMVLEILASRVIAPYYGTGLFVWSSIISVILASLSIGYYIGGRMADYKPSIQFLCYALFLAGLLTALSPLLKDAYVLSGIRPEFKYGGLVLSALLFALPSLLLGFVAPYSVRIAARSIKHVGGTAGSLYAVSTVGSIAGTLAAGFWLIPSYGVTSIIYGVSLVLVLLSLTGIKRKTLFAFVSAIVIIPLALSFLAPPEYPVLFVTDSEYYKITVYEDPGELSRRMKLDASRAGGVYLNSDHHLCDYSEITHLAYALNPEPERILVIGLGPGTQTKDAYTMFPNARVDVIEIDGAQVGVAEEYFGLDKSKVSSLQAGDARALLSTSKEKYDVIIVDAFVSKFSVPYHLITKEFIQVLSSHLTEDGVVCVNVISAVEGGRSPFFKSAYATYSSVFPVLYVVPSQSWAPEFIQNIMILAKKNGEQLSCTQFAELAKSSGDELAAKWADSCIDEPVKDQHPIILTDDYVPVDSLLATVYQ